MSGRGREIVLTEVTTVNAPGVPRDSCVLDVRHITRFSKGNWRGREPWTLFVWRRVIICDGVGCAEVDMRRAPAMDTRFAIGYAPGRACRNLV